jgi:hypothetical protein
MYTVIQSLTRDGRDRSLDYKISGFHVPPGCWDANVSGDIRYTTDRVADSLHLLLFLLFDSCCYMRGVLHAEFYVLSAIVACDGP